ncbi:MAG: hypothetical protein RIM80_27790 [Alphaproteobacteria bacterium]
MTLRRGREAAEQRHWFDVGFDVLEEQLRRRETAWPFSFGETPGWADLHLVPQVRKGVTRFNVDMAAYPLIGGVYARCAALPAFAAAAPENQPDYAGPFREPSLQETEGMG